VRVSESHRVCGVPQRREARRRIWERSFDSLRQARKYHRLQGQLPAERERAKERAMAPPVSVSKILLFVDLLEDQAQVPPCGAYWFNEWSLACWNARTAASVTGPTFPSTATVCLKPCKTRKRCKASTSAGFASACSAEIRQVRNVSTTALGEQGLTTPSVPTSSRLAYRVT
jgi:hypothetical protein